jgi:hypothetical protein
MVGEEDHERFYRARRGGGTWENDEIGESVAELSAGEAGRQVGQRFAFNGGDQSPVDSDVVVAAWQGTAGVRIRILGGHKISKVVTLSIPLREPMSVHATRLKTPLPSRTNSAQPASRVRGALPDDIAAFGFLSEPTRAVWYAEERLPGPRVAPLGLLLTSSLR